MPLLESNQLQINRQVQKTTGRMTVLNLCSVGYVGAATVGAAAWWFIAAEDGPRVNFYQLVSADSLHAYAVGAFKHNMHSFLGAN